MKIINSYRDGGLQEPNTFIGGVGATSVTSIADFIALTSGITASNISNFVIDANDNVSFFCDASYTINSNPTFTDITYYIDEKCTSLGENSFQGRNDIFYCHFPNVTSTGIQVWRNVGVNVLKVIAIPICTPIGGSVGENACFDSLDFLDYVITHLDNQTNNGGSPDGDLTQSGTSINNISYVLNTTSPSNITDLAVDTVGGVQLEISWTAPSSTNTIIFYEIWVDDAFVTLTAEVSFIITGLSLNTSFSIMVMPLDEFGNRSTSNIVTQTTSATYVIPTGDIVSYYDFDADSLDLVGTNDGSDTSISYATDGIVSKAADFNGSSSFITVADADNLSFTDGNDLPMSISVWIKVDVFTGGTFIVSKRDGSNAEFQLGFSGNSNDLKLLIFGSGVTGTELRWQHDNFSTGTLQHIVVTYDGSENATTSTMKLYLDGEQVTITVPPSEVGTYLGINNTTSDLFIGNILGGNHFNGLMDELALWDVELSAFSIREIFEKNTAGLFLTE